MLVLYLFQLFTKLLLLCQIQVMEDNSSAARANPTVMGGRSRARVGGGGRQAVGKNQQQQQRQNIDDLSGISSVVVTTSDGMQHHQHDLNDENVVAVSGIPGNDYFLHLCLTLLMLFIEFGRFLYDCIEQEDLLFSV